MLAGLIWPVSSLYAARIEAATCWDQSCQLDIYHDVGLPRKRACAVSGSPKVCKATGIQLLVRNPRGSSAVSGELASVLQAASYAYFRARKDAALLPQEHQICHQTKLTVSCIDAAARRLALAAGRRAPPAGCSCAWAAAARRARPAARQNLALRPAHRDRKTETDETLPQSRAETAATRLPRRAARPLSSTPPPLEEEEKAPASASERAQAFISNLTVADAARYGTYAAGGLGVYMVSKGVLGTINTLLHLPPTTVAKYGFYSGFLVASATSVAIRRALCRNPRHNAFCPPRIMDLHAIDATPARRRRRVHPTHRLISTQARPSRSTSGPSSSREALAMIRPRPSSTTWARRTRRRCRCAPTNWTGAFFFPGGASGVQWKPPRVVMMFAVEGAKEEGIVYLECLKNLNGRLHFTFVGVDVCDIAETRLIVHGSDERMTEKADHLQKLIDFKKDNSPPKGS